MRQYNIKNDHIFDIDLCENKISMGIISVIIDLPKVRGDD